MSVFDLRSATDEQLEQRLGLCFPLRRDYDDEPPALLVLGDAAVERLQSWEVWKTEEAWGDTVIADIEAGHPGPINVAEIDRVIVIDNKYTPTELELALRNVRR